MKKLTLILIAVTIVLLLAIMSCADQAPKAITVNNVYYGKGFGDIYYYGGAEHTDDNLYIIGVDLDTSQTGSNFIDVDWTDICSADNNIILWGGGIINPHGDFLNIHFC